MLMFRNIIDWHCIRRVENTLTSLILFVSGLYFINEMLIAISCEKSAVNK